MTTIAEHFDSEIKQINATYQFTKNFVDENKATPEHYEILITCSQFLAFIKKHGKEESENNKMEDLEKFFKSRWNRIKNTNLAYPHSPTDPFNKLLQQIAKKTNPTRVNSLLMPTVGKKTKSTGSAFSYAASLFDSLTLDQFILSDNNTFYISITGNEAKDIPDTVMNPVSGIIHHLTATEKARLQNRTKAYPDSEKTLWQQIIQQKYFKHLAKGLNHSIPALNSSISQVMENFDHGPNSWGIINPILRKIEIEKLIPSINAIKTAQVAKDNSHLAPLYAPLSYFQSEQTTALLDAYTKNDPYTLFKLLQWTAKQKNAGGVSITTLLDDAIEQLKHVDIRDLQSTKPSFLTQIQLLKIKNLSDEELILLTELTYRTTLFVEEPQRKSNLDRCIALVNEIGQRSWGQVLCAGFLCLIGIVGAATVIGAAIAVSHGSTLPFVLAVADKIATTVISIASAVLFGIGIYVGYRSKHHHFKVAMLGMFNGKEKPAERTSAGYERVADDEDDVADSASTSAVTHVDDLVGADILAGRSIDPTKLKPKATQPATTSLKEKEDDENSTESDKDDTSTNTEYLDSKYSQPPARVGSKKGKTNTPPLPAPIALRPSSRRQLPSFLKPNSNPAAATASAAASNTTTTNNARP